MQPEQQIAREENCRIKLERGQRGGYGWEIAYAHAPGEEQEAIERIQATDMKLRALYLTAGEEQ